MGNCIGSLYMFIFVDVMNVGNIFGLFDVDCLGGVLECFEGVIGFIFEQQVFMEIGVVFCVSVFFGWFYCVINILLVQV